MLSPGTDIQKLPASEWEGSFLLLWLGATDRPVLHELGECKKTFSDTEISHQKNISKYQISQVPIYSGLSYATQDFYDFFDSGVCLPTYRKYCIYASIGYFQVFSMDLTLLHFSFSFFITIDLIFLKFPPMKSNVIVLEFTDVKQKKKDLPKNNEESLWFHIMKQKY